MKFFVFAMFASLFSLFSLGSDSTVLAPEEILCRAERYIYENGHKTNVWRSVVYNKSEIIYNDYNADNKAHAELRAEICRSVQVGALKQGKKVVLLKDPPKGSFYLAVADGERDLPSLVSKIAELEERLTALENAK